MGLTGHLHVSISALALDYLVRQPVYGGLDFRVGELPAHETFYREQGVFRVGNGLPFGHLAYIPFSGLLVHGYHRRGRSGPLSIFHDYRLSSFDHGRYRVGGSEIDAQDFSH